MFQSRKWSWRSEDGCGSINKKGEMGRGGGVGIKNGENGEGRGRSIITKIIKSDKQWPWHSEAGMGSRKKEGKWGGGL